MADYSLQEKAMLGRWWGATDLQHNEEFWSEVLPAYRDKILPVPLVANRESARRFAELFKCNSCGECCRYDKIPINKVDLERIARESKFDMPRLISLTRDHPQTGTLAFEAGTKGCPLLSKQNKCKVYNCRPDTCYFFPLQPPKQAILGKTEAFQQMTIRLKCQPAVDVVRLLLLESLAGGGELMPDLSTIPPVERAECLTS